MDNPISHVLRVDYKVSTSNNSSVSQDPANGYSATYSPSPLSKTMSPLAVLVLLSVLLASATSMYLDLGEELKAAPQYVSVPLW